MQPVTDVFRDGVIADIVEQHEKGDLSSSAVRMAKGVNDTTS